MLASLNLSPGTGDAEQADNVGVDDGVEPINNDGEWAAISTLAQLSTLHDRKSARLYHSLSEDFLIRPGYGLVKKEDIHPPLPCSKCFSFPPSMRQKLETWRIPHLHIELRKSKLANAVVNWYQLSVPHAQKPQSIMIVIASKQKASKAN